MMFKNNSINFQYSLNIKQKIKNKMIQNMLSCWRKIPKLKANIIQWLSKVYKILQLYNKRLMEKNQWKILQP